MAPLTVQLQQASPEPCQLGAPSTHQTTSRNASTPSLQTPSRNSSPSSHQTSPWTSSPGLQAKSGPRPLPSDPEGGAQGPRPGPTNGCGRPRQSPSLMSPQQPPLWQKASGHKQESKRGGSCSSHGAPQWEATTSHVATPDDGVTEGQPLTNCYDCKKSYYRAHLNNSGDKDSDKVEDWLASSLIPTPSRDKWWRRASCEILVAESTLTSTTPTAPTSSTTSTSTTSTTAAASGAASAAAAALTRRQQRAEKHQRVRRLSDAGSDERAVRMLAEAVAQSCRQRMEDRRKLGGGASLLLSDLEDLGEGEAEIVTHTPN